ncbi:MAG TPA: hypothetical protein VFF29_03785 [Bacteroidota bacterium]|nr:hypothetical protein [Bacteroidota bacterium]
MSLVKEKNSTNLKHKRVNNKKLLTQRNASADPWQAVRGILKDKGISPTVYQRKTRRSWDR